MRSCKRTQCSCTRWLAVCPLKLAAEPDFAMASASDEERWARLGGGAVGADNQAELPEVEASQGEPSRGATEEEVTRSPWWVTQAAEWRQQGWSDGEIWSYLLAA